jgi:hypothetical protein
MYIKEEEMLYLSNRKLSETSLCKIKIENKTREISGIESDIKV